MVKKLYLIALMFVVLIAVFFRFYKITEVPAGLHADEASQAYNAFSILNTGKDMYGKAFPILFRANGSYQPPIYTYLTILPVSIWGNTIFSAKFISALSGVCLSIITYLIFIELQFLFKKDKSVVALIAGLIISIAPWSVQFSRLAVEANLSVTLFALSVLLLLKTLKNPYLFLPTSFLLGIGTHAYYSERITIPLLLITYLIIFKNELIKYKKIIILGLFIFALTQLPHLYLMKTGAFVRRFDQVGYISNGVIKHQGINKFIFVIQQFTDHYLMYYSPHNLFFDTGVSLGRTSPGLGVFFPWMLIPYFLGLMLLLKKLNKYHFFILGIYLLASIPASLTGDAFYPLRTLVYLWITTVIIALGLYQFLILLRDFFLNQNILDRLFLLQRKKINYVTLTNILFGFLLIGITLYSFLLLRVSYFVLFKITESGNFGYPYIKLMEILPSYSDKEIVVDFNPRAWGAGIRMSYLAKVDPNIMRQNLLAQMPNNYYDREIDANEEFVIGNTVVKPLNWSDICGRDLLIVGDRLTVSEEQVSSHHLEKVFEIEDLEKQPALFGYLSEKSKCEK